MPTATFITLGCKVNQYDTQAIRELLRDNGFVTLPDGVKADLCVINTCTVTNFADQKAKQLIRKVIRENPKSMVVVTGCYADSGKEEIESIPGVSFVVSNSQKPRLHEYVSHLAADLPKVSPFDISTILPHEDETFNLSITRFESQTRAIVKVQDGCSAFCTFCIIPYVRGPMRSRPLKSIIREVETLAANGYKEIVITGVHLGTYGEDINRQSTIVDIIESIHDIEGLERIRLSSIEPMDVPDELIKRMAALPKCAPHYHLPLQSGSDLILKRMKRTYTSKRFAEIVDKVRAVMPDAGITTDVMVGFPTEEEKHFMETYDFVEKSRFSRLHVFRYSPRQGTPATRMPKQVPPNVAFERSEQLRKLGERLMREFHESMISKGKEMDVLVETSREGKDHLLSGYTGNYIRTHLIHATGDMIGKMVKVRLKEIEGDAVRAEVIE